MFGNLDIKGGSRDLIIETTRFSARSKQEQAEILRRDPDLAALDLQRRASEMRRRKQLREQGKLRRQFL